MGVGPRIPRGRGVGEKGSPIPRKQSCVDRTYTKAWETLTGEKTARHADLPIAYLVL